MKYDDYAEWGGRYYERPEPPPDAVQESEVTAYEVKRFLIDYPGWKNKSFDDILCGILDCEKIYDIEELADEDGGPTYMVKHSPNLDWEDDNRDPYRSYYDENEEEANPDVWHFETPEEAAAGMKLDFADFFDRWAEDHDITEQQSQMIYKMASKAGWQFFHNELLEYFSTAPGYQVTDNEEVIYDSAAGY